MKSVPQVSFDSYADEVYGWAYRLLGRHHDALDVVQDVFIKWNQQCARSCPRQPRSWLRRVTFNRVIDLRRRQPALPESAAVETAPSQDTETKLDQAVLRSDVAAALDKLSEMQRSVLVAKVFDELTFAEIATELDLAVSTVKTHYLRAVQGVRARLAPRWGGWGVIMKCDQFENLLADALGGELCESDRPVFEAHLAECQKCRREYETSQAAVQVLKSLTGPRVWKRKGTGVMIRESDGVLRAVGPGFGARRRLFGSALRYAASVLIAFLAGYGVHAGLMTADAARRPSAPVSSVHDAPPARGTPLEAALMRAHRRNPTSSGLAKCMVAILLTEP